MPSDSVKELNGLRMGLWMGWWLKKSGRHLGTMDRTNQQISVRAEAKTLNENRPNVNSIQENRND